MQCVLRGRSGAVYLPCRKRAIEILRGGGEGLYFMRGEQCYLFCMGRVRFCALRGKGGALYFPLGQRGAAYQWREHLRSAFFAGKAGRCIFRAENGSLYIPCEEMAKLPGHALHEKGLQRQKGSQKLRAAFRLAMKSRLTRGADLDLRTDLQGGRSGFRPRPKGAEEAGGHWSSRLRGSQKNNQRVLRSSGREAGKWRVFFVFPARRL